MPTYVIELAFGRWSYYPLY